ncbi:glycosyltransferase [Paenibacillus ihumii]|uniref:glycosyltransferase n=1 Tax=Paenibacillus ihumii TaxID=687436 RepID=UPI0006D764E1|nr:glycosyltransferase [Paenibacillus ihumii]
MKRLKILFITKDFSQYLERNFYYLQLELAKHADLALCHEGGELPEILRRLPFTPDFILLNDMFHSTHCPPVEGVFDLQIPWGMIMHDLHGHVEKRKAFLARKPPNIFTIYRSAFRNRYPEYEGNLYWLPHFAEPTVFQNYHQVKDIDILLMGAINRRIYPLRYLMKTRYMREPGFVFHKHPGYANFDGNDQVLVAKRFAMEANRAKIFLTCDSIYKYSLRKYFEVPASYTLLMAPPNEDLRDLGFRPGVHYVAIAKHDYEDKVAFYLKPHAEGLRERITRQGYEFIHEKHTTATRAQRLLKFIQNIVKTS